MANKNNSKTSNATKDDTLTMETLEKTIVITNSDNNDPNASNRNLNANKCCFAKFFKKMFKKSK